MEKPSIAFIKYFLESAENMKSTKFTFSYANTLIDQKGRACDLRYFV